MARIDIVAPSIVLCVNRVSDPFPRAPLARPRPAVSKRKATKLIMVRVEPPSYSGPRATSLLDSPLASVFGP